MYFNTKENVSAKQSEIPHATRQVGYLASSAASVSARHVVFIRDTELNGTDPFASYTIPRCMSGATSFAIATIVIRPLKAALVRGYVGAMNVRDGSVVLAASEKTMRRIGTRSIARSVCVRTMTGIGTA